MTEGEPQLETLKCASCGADVPVGDAESATCVQCQATVPIPRQHAALRRLITSDTAARARAETVLAGLATPPSLATRVFAAIFDQGVFSFLLFFGAPVGIVAIMLALYVSAQLQHALHRADELPAPVTGAVVVLFVVLLAIIPRLVGVYASRRGAARRMLVASLAVGAPKLAGGPGTCRSCGAPVVVEENQAVARCMYCGADNVMKLPPWFLAAKAKLAGSVAHTLEAALAVDAAERANTRDSTLRELRRYATWAAIFGGLFSLQQWDYAREAVHDHGEFPVAGALATVGIVVAIFVMIFRSGASKQEAAARAARNEDNDLSWLGFAGPIAFWGVLYVVGQAWSVLYLALHRS